MANKKISLKDPIKRAKANPNSRQAAINAKCWDCFGAGADLRTRWQIGNCPATPHALFTNFGHINSMQSLLHQGHLNK